MLLFFFSSFMYFFLLVWFLPVHGVLLGFVQLLFHLPSWIENFQEKEYVASCLEGKKWLNKYIFLKKIATAVLWHLSNYYVKVKAQRSFSIFFSTFRFSSARDAQIGETLLEDKLIIPFSALRLLEDFYRSYRSFKMLLPAAGVKKKI